MCWRIFIILFRQIYKRLTEVYAALPFIMHPTAVEMNITNEFKLYFNFIATDVPWNLC